MKGSLALNLLPNQWGALSVSNETIFVKTKRLKEIKAKGFMKLGLKDSRLEGDENGKEKMG